MRNRIPEVCPVGWREALLPMFVAIGTIASAGTAAGPIAAMYAGFEALTQIYRVLDKAGP